jgi:predicted TIM-barrel fold metal-dependent hydrolase
MSHGPIDVHCHYFNGKYAFRELLEIGWRWLHGNYPYSSDELEEKEGFKFIPSGLGDLIEYVASFFATLVRSPKRNYKYEQKCFSESQWEPSQSIIAAPLMMDIFFVVDDGTSLKNKGVMEGLPKGQLRQALGATRVTSEESLSFSNFAEDLKQAVLDAFEQQSKSNLESAGPENDSDSVGEALDRVIDEFLIQGDKEALDTEKAVHENVQMSRGFRKHLFALRDLKRDYPDNVLSFLAVDPRRIGIAQLVEEYVGNGSFAGVKLYPPLGYFPSHPDLYPIYDFCVAHDIPITTHTSPGGFYTRCKKIHTRKRYQNGDIVEIDVDLSKYSTPSVCFAHPENWLEILENDKYRNLRINFAHFGGQKQVRKFADNPTQNAGWTGQIVRLMKDFSNVYADISYCPDPLIVQQVEKIVSHHSIVKDRLMFGTDFVMIMKDFELGGLKKYFNHFTEIYPEMLADNPRRFLGLG